MMNEGSKQVQIITENIPGNWVYPLLLNLLGNFLGK
jgi:hypothetical protein